MAGRWLVEPRRGGNVGALFFFFSVETRVVEMPRTYCGVAATMRAQRGGSQGRSCSLPAATLSYLAAVHNGLVFWQARVNVLVLSRLGLGDVLYLKPHLKNKKGWP